MDLSVVMQNTPLIVAGAAFFVVLGALYALSVFLNPERTARDRVADLTGGNQPSGDDLFIRPEPTSDATSRLGALASGDEEEATENRRMLLQAGFRNRNALEVFNAIRVMLTVSLALTGYAVTHAQKPILIALGVLLGMTAGYYIPKIFVTSRRESRQKELMDSFPDALDLLVSSVEAGLGLDAAFRRVSKEMESAAPRLARELQSVNYEVEAGIPRTTALRNLDERTGLQEVNSLVNVLLQAERFGTSVAEALRVHSSLVRKKRMLAAEESAAKISPKLTLAMIIFILPLLFTVLAGPAAINVVNNLLPAMGG
jgi:tight adherence protein C